jgi:hypothetical protein
MYGQRTGKLTLFVSLLGRGETAARLTKSSNTTFSQNPKAFVSDPVYL